MSKRLIPQFHIMEHIVTKKVSPIPRGYRTATTCLTVFDVDSAVAFYQAAFAGPMYGQIHISTRYPSFAALAAANPKIVADPEHDRAVEELAAVKREILSHYMLRDKTPD